MAAATQRDGEITLSRTLGLLDITMIGVGAMIGAGIFVLTGIAAGEAGPALVLAFLLNGIVTTFTALSYAELGSCFPEAGGGYLWVKEGLGGTQGFLAGWMSWFAHAVACSLYGLGFGRFAVELLILSFPNSDIPTETLTLIFMAIIVSLFAFINFRGASETGLVGNVVTIAKIVILGIFVAFGIRAMVTRPDLNVFTDSFLPHGIGGVFVAMGLTFIAFEGYEIIAQSGEEVKDPKRNIPAAIFISLAVVVLVYLLVAVVAIGAVRVPASAGNIPVWDYLAEAREVAIVRAAEQFMGRWGGILVLISGLASTMSALNATIYSSSRVSFAMGRGRNLPALFGEIHPRMHTPHWAVAISAVLIIVMALLLPVEEVTKSADVMFLLMFAQVNVTVISLRRRRPDLDRGYSVPIFPWPAIIGIATNVALALFLVFESGRVGLVTVLWLVGGSALYLFYFRHTEREVRPEEIVFHRQATVSARYTVLVPVSSMREAPEIGRIGSLLALAGRGEVLALHVIELPPQIPLVEGRLLAHEKQEPLHEIEEQAQALEVPIHSMMRVGRSTAEAIMRTAQENASDLIVLGWNTFHEGEWRYSRVIDRIMAAPPVDTVVVRARPFNQLHRIVVPVAGGPNTRLAAKIGASLAAHTAGETEVVLLHVRSNTDNDVARIERVFRQASNGLDFQFTTEIVTASSPDAGILKVAENCDMVVMGASADPLLRKWRRDNAAHRVAKNASCPVVMAHRRGARRL